MVRRLVHPLREIRLQASQRHQHKLACNQHSSGSPLQSLKATQNYATKSTFYLIDKNHHINEPTSSLAPSTQQLLNISTFFPSQVEIEESTSPFASAPLLQIPLAFRSLRLALRQTLKRRKKKSFYARPFLNLLKLFFYICNSFH